MRRGAGPAMVPYMWDPAAAAACIAAGEGAVLRLSLGGKSSDKAGGPLETEARVLWAGRKTYRITGQLSTGMVHDLGSTALVAIPPGDATIVVRLISAQYSAINSSSFHQSHTQPGA